jgi:hypothetical protein
MNWLSDYARMAVPTSGDAHAEPDFYIKMGRHISMAAQEIKFVGVCHMLAEGHTWPEVARAVGLPDVDAAIEIYEAPYERWRRGDPNPWRTRVSGVAAMPTDAYGDPDALAGVLDNWCASLGKDAALVPGARAVSDGLY